MIFKYFFLLTLFVSCSSNSKNELNKSVDFSINQLNELYNAKLIGSGGGSTDNKKRLISLSFEVPKKLTINEGRKLIIAFTNIVLENINKEENRNYLYNYPFTINNLDLTLYNSYGDSLQKVYYPYLFAISISKHGVYYSFRTETKNSYIEEESYEEALQKLKDEQ